MSAANGLPTEICAFNRSMDGLIRAGVAPKGAMAAWHGSSCDNTPRRLQNVAKVQNIPTFFMDRPYKIFTEHTVAYWRKQNEELIAFLEKVTGKKMDYDRLKEAVDLSYRRLTQLCLEIDKLLEMVPTPMSCEAAFGPILAARQFGGHPKANAFMTLLRDELKERVANGFGRRNRNASGTSSTSPAPISTWALLGLAQKKYGAVVVARPHRALARNGRMVDRPRRPGRQPGQQAAIQPGQRELSAPAVEQRDQILELAQKTKADAAIFWNNIGCRMGASMWRDPEGESRERVGCSQPHHRLRHPRPDLRPQEGRRGANGPFLRNGREQHSL